MNMDDKVSAEVELDKLADTVCTQFHIVFAALPDEVPATFRLRALLKRALRDLNLRCVSVREVR